LLRSLSVPAALVAAVTIAACGSSSGGSTTQSGSANPLASAPGASAPAGSSGGGAPPSVPDSGGSGKTIDVCTVLPIAKMNQITGKHFSTTKGRTAGGFISHCEYGGGTLLLQVEVTTAMAQHFLDEDVSILKQIGHPPNMVSGVGSAAFSLPDPNGNAGSVGAAASASFGAVIGDAYIKIGGFPYVNAAQGKQICTILAAAL
jgi:hypothetical protein